jgi:predicted N-formylglutamate amidohydrolase
VPELPLLVTCEHGGCRLPRTQRALFRGAARLLASHRGWDPGALAAARRLARASGAPLVTCTITRLLVDANRSPHNPAVFSAVTRELSRDARAALLARHHRPHWERVRAELARLAVRRRPVLHVAVHSFTPVRRGERRRFDVGLLYDPRRGAERALARTWRALLLRRAPELRVRLNAPYRGAADGLTSALRRELGARAYLGLELELNQSRLADRSSARRLLAALADSLAATRRARTE